MVVWVVIIKRGILFTICARLRRNDRGRTKDSTVQRSPGDTRASPKIFVVFGRRILIFDKRDYVRTHTHTHILTSVRSNEEYVYTIEFLVNNGSYRRAYRNPYRVSQKRFIQLQVDFRSHFYPVVCGQRTTRGFRRFLSHYPPQQWIGPFLRTLLTTIVFITMCFKCL